MMKNYSIWYLYLLLMCSCNTLKDEVVVEEEYEKLFPNREIEKPENKRGELLVELCDPAQALEDYRYPGTEQPADAERYTVTLTCSFAELDRLGNFVPEEKVTAQYIVKYIGADKKLKTVTCKRADDGKEEESEDDGEDAEEYKEQVMSNDGEELKISFEVYSGFPLYLCVTGVGPRNSHVKASIKAVSTDGLIEIPALESEQYQNEEGPNMLRHPYCEYMILP